MGSCMSAPVGDSTAASSQPEKLHQADNAPAKTRQSRDHQGPSVDGAACNEQPESSKSVLGRIDDMKSRFAFDKVLGKGQFGVTRLVVDKQTGEQLACKSISKRKLVNPEDIEDVRREIKVMHHLSGHANVVTFKGAYEDNHHIHIVMELCTGMQQQQQTEL